MAKLSISHPQPIPAISSSEKSPSPSPRSIPLPLSPLPSSTPRSLSSNQTSPTFPSQISLLSSQTSNQNSQVQGEAPLHSPLLFPRAAPPRPSRPQTSLPNLRPLIIHSPLAHFLTPPTLSHLQIRTQSPSPSPRSNYQSSSGPPQPPTQRGRSFTEEVLSSLTPPASHLFEPGGWLGSPLNITVPPQIQQWRSAQQPEGTELAGPSSSPGLNPRPNPTPSSSPALGLGSSSLETPIGRARAERDNNPDGDDRADTVAALPRFPPTISSASRSSASNLHQSRRPHHHPRVKHEPEQGESSTKAPIHPSPFVDLVIKEEQIDETGEEEKPDVHETLHSKSNSNSNSCVVPPSEQTLLHEDRFPWHVRYRRSLWKIATVVVVVGGAGGITGGVVWKLARL